MDSSVAFTVSREPSAKNKSGITTKYSLVAFSTKSILVVLFAVVVLAVETAPVSPQATPFIANTLFFSI